MFKNFISAAFMGVVMASCGGIAQAQQTQASNQIVVGQYKTVDLLSARSIDLTPGLQSITDHNNLSNSITLQHVEAVTFADGFKNYVRVGSSNVYINLSQTSAVDCQNGQTVIYWHSAPQGLNDGCAFAVQVNSLSRR